MGLGNGRQRAGTGLPKEVRFGDRAERAHSPNDAKGRRKRDVSYRSVYGVSATAAGQGRLTGAHEGAGGAVEELAGNYRCELHAGSARVGGCGFFARVKVN